MGLFQGHIARIREHWPIFLVAVGVVMVSTVAGSVFDRVHKINAEELAASATSAVPGPNNTQVVSIGPWGVQLTTPLAAEMPTLRYTNAPGESVGLSSKDLEALGDQCHATKNALGVLSRFPAGTYAKTQHSGTTEYFINKIGDYEFTYRIPTSACADTEAGRTIINTETSVIVESLESLSAIGSVAPVPAPAPVE